MIYPFLVVELFDMSKLTNDDVLSIYVFIGTLIFGFFMLKFSWWIFKQTEWYLVFFN